MASENKRKLAVVTGASSGIGFELARQCVDHGFDAIICSELGDITSAAADLARGEAIVIPVQADLSSYDGVEFLAREIVAMQRPVDVLMLNAGIGAGGAFVDVPLDDELKMVALNCNHTVHLAKRVLPEMLRRNEGRILITGAVVSTAPSPYQVVYAATKAFVMAFGDGLRRELADYDGCKVTVTVLQPRATDTEFYARAGLADTRAGRADKDDPARVARHGFEAMMAGRNWIQGSGDVGGAGDVATNVDVMARQLAKSPRPSEKH
jgi:short-subunit dehydrogenase